MNALETIRTIEPPEAIVGHPVPDQLCDLVGKRLLFRDPIDGIETRGEVVETFAGFLVVNTEVTDDVRRLIEIGERSSDDALTLLFRQWAL